MDHTSLKEKACWVRKETLKIHKTAPGIRLASALSCVELLTVLYYGKFIKFDPKNMFWEGRDRFIISKAHGVVSLYPILADMGFFPAAEIERVGKAGSILSDIPDCSIPGFETVNGSLGHGLGVACGVALALKKLYRKEKVVVLSGDGELFEGSVWEAIMFAGHHRLNNLTLLIDNNKRCMLDYCEKIIGLNPLEDKFKAFGWKTQTIDGHNIEELYNTFSSISQENFNAPQVIIADTVKGKGVPSLEKDPLCHIRMLKPNEIDSIINEME